MEGTSSGPASTRRRQALKMSIICQAATWRFGDMRSSRCAVSTLGTPAEDLARGYRFCVRLRQKGYRLLYDGDARIIHRAARWVDPSQRLRPGLVWAMTRDDAYFRVKNYGWSGVWGAMRSAVVSVKARVVQAAANLFLIAVHSLAWIPGAIKGLRSKNDPFGTLGTQ